MRRRTANLASEPTLPPRTLERAAELAREVATILDERMASCAPRARNQEAERAAQMVVFLALSRMGFYRFRDHQMPHLREASETIETILTNRYAERA